MKHRRRPGFLAVSAMLLALPVAALGILGLSTGSSQAGGDDVSWELRSFMEGSPADDGAFLGVHLDDASEPDVGGARVTQIVRNSAAERAGLEVGDLIVELDGKGVSGPMGLSELVESKKVGDRVALRVVRDGGELTLDAELGARESDFRVMGLPDSFRHFRCDDDDDDCGFSFDFECEGDDCQGIRMQMPHFGSRPLLGVQLVEMTSELRMHMGADADEGVLVSRVVEESAAEVGGIEVGDVIVAVGGSRIEDTEGLRHALSRHAGESIDIDVVRGGRTTTLDVMLPAEAGRVDR